MLKPLPLNEVIKYSIPGNLISAEGEALIKNYLTSQTGYDLWHREDGIEWTWVTERGTLPKRIANHMYKIKNNPIKLTEQQMSEIGNLASRHCNKVTDYHFDFVNHFNGWIGSFGDRTSCFIGKDSTVFYSMQADGYLGIRFYDPANKLGVARAFIKPDKNLDCYIVFNGYGMEKLSVARVFASWLGYTYKQVVIVNNAHNGKELFINKRTLQEEGTGYIVFEPTNVNAKTLTEVDLKTPIRTDPKYFRCGNCGGRYPNVQEHPDNPHKGDGAYCVDCFNARFTVCNVCRKALRKANAMHIDDKYFCGKCYELHYISCFLCRTVISKEHAHERLVKTVHGNNICREHGYYYANTCVGCGHYMVLRTDAFNLCGRCEDNSLEFVATLAFQAQFNQKGGQ